MLTWSVWCCLESAMDLRIAMDSQSTTAARRAASRETVINFIDRIWHASTPYFRRKWRHRTAAVPDSVDRSRPVRRVGVAPVTCRQTMTKMAVVGGIHAAVVGCRPSRRPGLPTPSPSCRARSTVSRGRGDPCPGRITTPTTPTTTHTGTVRVPRGDVGKLLRCRCRVGPAIQTHVGDSWPATSSLRRATKTATTRAHRPRRRMFRLWRHLSYRLNTEHLPYPQHRDAPDHWNLDDNILEIHDSGIPRYFPTSLYSNICSFSKKNSTVAFRIGLHYDRCRNGSDVQLYRFTVRRFLICSIVFMMQRYF